MKKLLVLIFLIPIIGFSQNKKELYATIQRMQNDSINLELLVDRKNKEIKENNEKIDKGIKRIEELYTNSFELKKTNKSYKNEIDTLKIKFENQKNSIDSLKRITDSLKISSLKLNKYEILVKNKLPILCLKKMQGLYYLDPINPKHYEEHPNDLVMFNPQKIVYHYIEIDENEFPPFFILGFENDLIITDYWNKGFVRDKYGVSDSTRFFLETDNVEFFKSYLCRCNEKLDENLDIDDGCRRLKTMVSHLSEDKRKESKSDCKILIEAFMKGVGM